ncbi:palmitoyltransferas-like protein akr1 [Mytilinidion resinicola]|uniref:Palmitoyltransferase n=1 Tax=Mytilinidion resinicola TaxID=574789 RepID=A0A6A6YC78_9PEZI|nr:palmitoyltransferas-like protein akr1 [Mytilinidion resinicola]KAF2805705.1 palmitoyltransferas-like protein akr1 [Mytilinidion resinicola]
MSSSPTSASARAEQTSNGKPVGGEQHVELEILSSGKPSMPIEEDIMQLARLGEIGAIQKLFDSGKFDANYADEQGITLLHWAAINNHYALCHFLIQNGANVNAKGGDAMATAVLWAAKRCHYYVVHLLLQHGADPLLTDDQGFNLLHSATLDGNVFQLVLLLHQDIPVDIPDAQAHTSLMWAAYKGFPSCVDLFLRWGANVYAKDDQGFTALHWALVKGSQGSMQKLIEYGSDRFAKNNDGKTPATTASEMNTQRQWYRALSECGYNKDGTTKEFPLSFMVKDVKTFLNRATFLLPFPMILGSMYALSHMVIYFAVPTALAIVFGLQWIGQYSLRWAPSNMKNIGHTPFMAGIFTASMFWVGVRWLTTLLPWTFITNPFLNVFFVTFYGLSGYFYFMSMNEDPGFVPKSGSRSGQKAVIDELVELRQFDEHHFCVNCMVRKPLRSRHCKRCNRCVAKSDHHCPWVNNCVANNNHRHFFLYVLTLEIGLIFLMQLVLAYLSIIPTPKDVTCNVLSDDLCKILHKDPYTIDLSLWCAAQSIWVTMLVVVQLLQIARALTTFESMRGHLNSHTPGEALTSFVTTGTTSQEVTGASNGFGSGQDIGDVPRRPHQHHSVWNQWKRLLGLDTFFATAFRGSQANQARSRGNPFSHGIIRNCKDFFCDGSPIFGFKENGSARLGGERVDYTRLYEPPPRMTMRRSEGNRAAYAAVDTDDTV